MVVDGLVVSVGTSSKQVAEYLDLWTLLPMESRLDQTCIKLVLIKKRRLPSRIETLNSARNLLVV